MSIGLSRSAQAWTSGEISSKAYMEELCGGVGGYRRFLGTLLLHHFGWWAAVTAVPGVFLDHHRCEAGMPYLAWCLYGGTVLAMLVMAVLLELTMVQRLGLLQEIQALREPRWRRPLTSTVLCKLDAYTDMAFVFIARDCGSSLWWASLASIIFCTIFCQMIFNVCFAWSDCDGELPESLGFVLLDFKLVNCAVKSALPFDPDASDLPVAKPVTLRSSANLVGLEKVVGDVAQVCIQSLFLMSASAPHGFVVFSIALGAFNGGLSIALIVQDALQEEFAVQDRELEQGTVLAPLSGEAKHLEEGTSSAMPTGPSPERSSTAFRRARRHGLLDFQVRSMAEEADPEREAKLQQILEKLDVLMTKENLQEDSFIQMNMDAQMNIPICVLAGHEKFEEMGQLVDVSLLLDAALRSQQVVVDKEAMQLKPIIKSKRNTVILHDLPNVSVEELQDLFLRCPTQLTSIKLDVNSTAFVSFPDDGAAQDAALWLRSQELRGGKVKCSIKSEQFLRSFFPMKPVPNYQSYGVPQWAAAWTGWAQSWPAWGGKEGKGEKGMEKGEKGMEKGMEKGFKGAGDGKAKGKGKGKGGKGKDVPGAMVEAPSEPVEDEDETLGYRHSFRRYTRQQIIEICGTMELVEKPESYKKMEATTDIALFSLQANKDWAPLPTPMGSYLGSESRKTEESDDERRPKKGSPPERESKAQNDWENWQDWQDWQADGWSSYSDWYRRGRVQWVAKAKPGEDEKLSWAEKVRGGTQKWQPKSRPEESVEAVEAAEVEPDAEPAGEAKPSWADKVRSGLR